MLATCVNMDTYSLARLRRHRPEPPFWLGGEYMRLDDKQLLVDATGSVILEGNPGDFHSGELLRVEVLRLEGERAYIGRAEKVRSAPPSRGGIEHALAFPRFVNEVRAYFRERGLHEIYTPTLVRCPGLEPTLEPFKTSVNRGSRQVDAYLPTSPEIHLKKAMGRGLTDLFEIKACFRAGEYGSQHDHEFTMLEWYRGFADLELVIEDLRGLIAHLAEEGWCEPTEVRVTDFASLFREHAGVELKPTSTAEDLRPHAPDARADDTFTDLFHRILIDRVEPKLKGALIIRRFPPEMAALSRILEDGWADRFEFYWEGLEIANAFNEVTDASEQRKRWDGEMAERRRLGTSTLPDDPELIRALERGLPPTGGIALGVERLYMACTGVKDIRELKLFAGEELFV